MLVFAGSADPHQVAALLALLAAKGEVWEEVAGFARAMRERLVPAPGVTESAIDIVGTGGDGHNTVNISTTAAVLAAACGAKVAKHGSVSVSSSSGSADVLRSLGVAFLGPDAIASCIDDCGIAFLFAPLFHPAMKHVVPVRKALRVRTIFNILGPLLNPATSKRFVLGVYHPRLLHVFGKALAALGVEHGLVVHCCGLDELAPIGVAAAVEIRGHDVAPLEIDTLAICERCTIEELRGGTPEENAEAMRTLLRGGDAARGPVGRTVALNAGAGLYVAGLAASIQEGYDLALEALVAGKGGETLESWVAASQRLASGSS